MKHILVCYCYYDVTHGSRIVGLRCGEAGLKSRAIGSVCSVHFELISTLSKLDVISES